MITGSVEVLLNALRDSFYALISLVMISVIIQIFILKLPKSKVYKISRGFILSFLGLTLFLGGINLGFIPLSNEIGTALGETDNKILVIFIGLILGWIVTLAEPAINILNHQIEDVTTGYINKRTVLYFISIGVSLSVVLSIVRIYTGISFWYFILPGYALVFILSKFVSPLFLAIAFDSGGVITGPMVASVLLAIMVSFSNAIEGSNPLLDGFGMIALVALMPIISIMILGLIYEKKLKEGVY